MAQLVLLDPRCARIAGERTRTQIDPERVHVVAVAEVEQFDRVGRGVALQRRVVGRPHLRRRQIALARFEAKQLGVLARHNLHRDAVERRQRRSARVLAPVTRIAGEDDALAADELAQHERTEAGDVLQRRVEAPRARERAGLQRRIQLVPRENRQVVQNPQSDRERRRERDDDRMGIGRRDAERLAAHFERVDQRTRGFRVVHRRQRERHVIGRKRLAIGERDVRTELDRVPQAVIRPRPAFSEPRLELPGDAIDADKLGLRQETDQIVGAIALTRDPVERGWVAAIGEDQVAARVRARRGGGTGFRTAHPEGAGGQEHRGNERRNGA